MEIRGAYESELEQTVELSCLAFNPDGHERYWAYMRGDRSYRLPQTRVVVVNGRVVSTLRVWERRIRVGASLVTMGGIGGVCTHPKYRGAGYASALMRNTMDYLRLTGCDIGVLFTIIPEPFYEKLGWTSLPLHGFVAERCAEGRAESPTGWTVDAFKAETDLERVAELYDLSNAAQSGAIARTRTYWDTAPSRIRGVLPTRVARRDGQIHGYLNYEVSEDGAAVHEVGYTPNNTEALAVLVSDFLEACEAVGVETVEGSFSPRHPFVAHLTAGNRLTQTTNTKMMLSAVDLPVLLRRLVVGWESRIADAEEMFSPFSVRLPTPNNSEIVLRHNRDGTLQIVSGVADAVDLGVDVTEADFWQLLFGEIGWVDLGAAASVSAEISAFLEVLFPKRDVIFWSPDRY